jgi:hypothetical protein
MKKKKPSFEIELDDLDWGEAKRINSLSDVKVNAVSLKLSGSDMVSLCQARVLARALGDIQKAYLDMDEVFFNPATEHDLRMEITEKIVALLQGMDFGHPEMKAKVDKC